MNRFPALLAEKPLRISLAAFGLLLFPVISCRYEMDSPMDPDSPTYAGDGVSQDKDGNGIADFVEEYAPGCQGRPCLQLALKNKRAGLGRRPYIANWSLSSGISINDSLAVGGWATSLYDLSYSWDLDGDGDYQDTTGISQLKLHFPALGTYRFACRIESKAAGFSAHVDTVVVIQVEQDPPVAVVGSDFTVLRGDSVLVSGQGTDGHGSIVAMEWDIGATGTFKASQSGRFKFLAPSKADTQVVCIFRVTDDDGNSGIDTVVVKVPATGSKWIYSGTLDSFTSFLEGPCFEHNGKLHVMNSLEELEIYYLNSGSWKYESGYASPSRFSAASFGGAIWITGGLGSDRDAHSKSIGYLMQSYSTNLASLKLKKNHASVVFKSSLRVLGGDGDPMIASTLNGTTWDSLPSPLPAATRPSAFVFLEKMFYIGKGEVWASSDGRAWEMLSRIDRQSCAATAYDGKIILTGGSRLGTETPLETSVLESEDGVRWKVTAGATDIPGITGHCSTVAEGKLWVVGGRTADGGFTQAWYTK